MLEFDLPMKKSVARLLRAELRSIAFIASMLALGACSSGPTYYNPLTDPDASVIQGRNVTFFYHPNAVPCVGTVPYLDSNVDAIASYLGVQVPAPIEYHFTQQLPCAPEAYGCVESAPQIIPEVWANVPDTVHELTHAVQFCKTSPSVAFINEAEAVALGEAYYYGVVDGLSDTMLLTPDPLPGDYYPTAGDFGSYLLTTYGPAPLEQVFSAVPKGSPPDAVEAEFTVAYGESMAQLRADRADSGLVFPWDRIKLTECMALEPDDSIADGGAVSETVDCTANAVGVFDASMYRMIPFDIADDGLYTIDLEVPDNAGATLTGCATSTQLDWGSSSWIPAQSIVVGYLAHGRYALGLGAPSEAGVTFTVTVHPIALGTHPACASVPVLSIPQGTRHLFVFSTDDATVEIPFELGSPAIASGWRGLAAQAQICLDGCDQGCSATDASSPNLSVDVTYTVAAQFVANGRYVAIDFE